MLVMSSAFQDPGAAAPAAPGRVAIYYGIPSLVNGAGGDVSRAAAVFGAYDVVVFGDGLQYAAPPERTPWAGAEAHARTRQIIQLLARTRPSTQVFGYVPLGDTSRLTADEVAEAVRQWHDMGVQGIFLDEAGYDYGVTRDRQNDVVSLIHDLRMRAFVNAFDPDDVLSDEAVALNSRGGGNPAGEPSRLDEADLLLVESFVVRNGVRESADVWKARTEKAASYRRSTGITIVGVTTTTRRAGFNRSLCDQAWKEAVAWELSGFGWGEPDYAAGDSVLPPRACGSR